MFSMIMALSLLATNMQYLVQHNSNAADENDSIIIEREGVIPDGGAYKNLDFYTGEVTIEDICGDRTLNLPSYFDISMDPCFPELGDQGNLGSCVAFATTYYQFSYEVNKKNGVNSANDRVVYSPKWTYNLINDGVDSGANINDAMLILNNYGALKYADLPYDSDYMTIPGDVNSSLGELIPERMEALKTRVSSLGSISLPNYGTFITGPNDSDLDVVKALISNGKCLIISTKTGFDTKYGIDHNNSPIKVNYRCTDRGGHAMAVVGYDDDVWCDVNGNNIIEDCEKGAFKIANSYGSNGLNSDTNGFKWVLYDALNEISANTVNDWESLLNGTRVQALRSAEDSPTFWYINVDNYDTHYVGKININTGNGKLSDCQFNIGRATVNSNNVTYSSHDMLPTHNGGGTYNGKILFDYDYLCNPIDSYLSGYSWYVNFSSLSGTYSISVVDDMDNTMTSNSVNDSTAIKHVDFNTLYGDVYYDNALTQIDALMIQQYVLGNRDFSTLQVKLSDCNHDGLINLADAIYVLQNLS